MYLVKNNSKYSKDTLYACKVFEGKNQREYVYEA